MPSFDVLLLSAPLGFVDSCLLINQFSETKENELQLIIKEVWDLELKKITESQTTSLSQESPETIKKIKRVITFIIQSMKQAQPTPSISNTANVLASKSFLTKECIEKILLTIKEVSSQAANEEISPLEIAKTHGKLSNFQWKIGVSISSSNCKQLFHPYVTISYDVLHDDGRKLSYSGELSIDQFKELKKSFQKVAKAMDSI